MIKYTYIKNNKQCGSSKYSDDYTNIIPLIETVVKLDDSSKKETEYLIDKSDYFVEVIDYTNNTISMISSEEWYKKVKTVELKPHKESDRVVIF